MSQCLLKDVQLLPQDRGQSWGVAFEQEEECVNVTELFHRFLNFPGVEAGFVACVLKSGSVDDGDTFIGLIS